MPMDVRDRPPRPGDGSGICEPPPDERRERWENRPRCCVCGQRILAYGTEVLPCFHYYEAATADRLLTLGARTAYIAVAMAGAVDET